MSRQSPPRTRSQLHRTPPEAVVTASPPLVRPTTRSMSLKRKHDVGQPSNVNRRVQRITSMDAKAPRSTAAQNHMMKQSALHSSSSSHVYSGGSQHSIFLCGICFDYKPSSHMFKNGKCNHSFCSACMAKYVTSQINQNIVKVTCPHPNCPVEQNPKSLHPILPRKVIEKWDMAICESTISASQKTYQGRPCIFEGLGANNKKMGLILKKNCKTLFYLNKNAK
ncbi:unnamed protein product [Cuscuta epithymum]|uniref:RING-type domain-containing protein n=1 Tax=Cuscuta epithymum TaxID=186058 RepID=A0AAV0DAG0_9ASTE|nr:unnamed protein product [Cuscuta epithymum]